MMAQTGHAGSPKSWVAVGIMLLGFLLGGIALVIGPAWWLFWLGAAVVVAGGIFGLAVGIVNDTVEDDPRVLPG
jgi:hypothetical protein